jgi:hypothetical protein
MRDEKEKAERGKRDWRENISFVGPRRGARE